MRRLIIADYVWHIEDLIVHNIIVPQNYCMPRTREQPKAIFFKLYALCLGFNIEIVGWLQMWENVLK